MVGNYGVSIISNFLLHSAIKLFNLVETGICNKALYLFHSPLIEKTGLQKKLFEDAFKMGNIMAHFRVIASMVKLKFLHY